MSDRPGKDKMNLISPAIEIAATQTKSAVADWEWTLMHSLEVPWQGIHKTWGVMGGEACVRDTRISVWLLVSYCRLGLSEAKLLDNYPMLTANDLVNAWSYASAYADEIDRAIAQQEEE
jgi:uncharacterized protein (DUF433 family)